MTQIQELLTWSNSEIKARKNISKTKALLRVAERMIRRRSIFLGVDYDKIGTEQGCRIARKRWYHVELWRGILERKRGENT